MLVVLRTIAGIVVGLVAAFVLVIAVEAFGSVAHPVPKDFGGTMEEMCRHVERFPQWVLAVSAVAWAGTAFVGTWTSKKLGNLYSFAVVALLLLGGMIFNIAKLPYPIWFKIACLILVPAAIFGAGRCATPRKTAGGGESKEEGLRPGDHTSATDPEL
jgi:hypothetical protein